MNFQSRESYRNEDLSKENQSKGSGPSAFRDVIQGDHSINIRTHLPVRLELL